MSPEENENVSRLCVYHSMDIRVLLLPRRNNDSTTPLDPHLLQCITFTSDSNPSWFCILFPFRFIMIHNIGMLRGANQGGFDCYAPSDVDLFVIIICYGWL